jgi:hypothetical protein
LIQVLRKAVGTESCTSPFETCSTFMRVNQEAKTSAPSWALRRAFTRSIMSGSARVGPMGCSFG